MHTRIQTYTSYRLNNLYRLNNIQTINNQVIVASWRHMATQLISVNTFSIGRLGMNFREISTTIRYYALKKMHIWKHYHQIAGIFCSYLNCRLLWWIMDLVKNIELGQNYDECIIVLVSKLVSIFNADGNFNGRIPLWHMRPDTSLCCQCKFSCLSIICMLLVMSKINKCV